MQTQPIRLTRLLDLLAQCSGKVTIVDPIYDEQCTVTHFDTAHNLETFFACIDDNINDLTLDDILADISQFDEVGDYGVYAFMSPNDDFRSALPVTDAAITDDGRVLLFV